MSNTRQGRGKGILSAIIDPMLFEGGHRLCEITEAILVSHPGQYTKAQLVNNVRSRVTALTKRGYVLERDATNKHIVRLVKTTVSTPAVV